MVTLSSVTTQAADTDSALADLAARFDHHARPAFVCVFYDADHDDRRISAFLNQRFPDAAIIGGTSCGGVMTEAGLSGKGAIGLLVVDDVHGHYGSASVRLDADPAGCAERALRTALDDADCEGELPELIWIYQAPGNEEAAIAGLRRVVGDRCPIIGGSAADDGCIGRWRQLGPDGPDDNSLVIAVLFPSGGIGFAYQGGYEATGASGVVTRIGADTLGPDGRVVGRGGRQILTIDDEPAAEVYNRWIGGALDSRLGSSGSILTDTTMWPLGVDVGQLEDVAHYLLIHPEQLLPGGGLSTFAAVEVGTRVCSMHGERGRLIERAGRVATAAAAVLPGGADQLAGALIVYCAGCRLAVGSEMPAVARTVTDGLGGKPFLGCFTFGEQGFLLDRNTHGNLMISAVAFGR